MNWITASFLMFVSSVALYLLVRKSSLEKIPTQLNNLAMFLVPLLVYIFMAYATHADMHVSWYQLLVIAILAIFFSYLGNNLSLKSISLAPNPGYSLVLSKSYVVFTTIAAIFLFGSELTLRSVVAITSIVCFSALIMVNKKRGETLTSDLKDTKWLILAIGAFFCWGMLALTTKYLLILGVSILARLIYSMIIVVLLIGVEIRHQKIRVSNLGKSQWLLLISIGILAALFNYFMLLGIDLAPNIGYVNAINASSISLVTLFSYFLFNDELNKRKMIGIIGVTAGLILLVT
jgi:drug/metabolite transporter (DMT)-like permease